LTSQDGAFIHGSSSYTSINHNTTRRTDGHGTYTDHFAFSKLTPLTSLEIPTLVPFVLAAGLHMSVFYSATLIREIDKKVSDYSSMESGYQTLGHILAFEIHCGAR
jgi:hypothetical protein